MVAELAVTVAVDMAMAVVVTVVVVTVTVVVESFECKLSTFHQLTPGL